MDGVIVVDKPCGPTSHDIVALVRKILRVPKAGHCGTLDPAATGVLVIAVGRATRLFPYLSGHGKSYAAAIRFGFATDTYDAAGRPTGPISPDLPSEAALREAMARMTGRIRQVPPAYSALKKDGQPLYKLARADKAVEPEPREVVVERFELKSWAPPLARVEVDCSAGTYVRSLAHDLGRALGCGAHLAALRRTASGPFRAAEALTIEALEAEAGAGRAAGRIVPMEELLPELPAIVLGPEGAERARHGNRVTHAQVSAAPGGEADLTGAEVFRLLGPDGRLVALARRSPEGPGFAPFVVLSA